jgi:hypothetical protein
MKFLSAFYKKKDNELDTYFRIIDIICSCKTQDQLDNCHPLIFRYRNKYPKSSNLQYILTTHLRMEDFVQKKEHIDFYNKWGGGWRGAVESLIRVKELSGRH